MAGMDIKLTTQDVWLTTLLFGAVGLILLVPLAYAYRAPAFERSAAWLTAASALFWGVCATTAILLAWDFYYRYIYPAWSRWLAPFDALFYGLVGLGMWWLALRLPGSPVVWFVILGGLEGVAEHVFGIYALHILDKVPWLSGLPPFPLIIFSFFEYIVYWSLTAWLGLGLLKISQVFFTPGSS
jgi:hypothetical protein